MRLFKRNILRDLPASSAVVERDGKRWARVTDGGRQRLQEIVAVRRKGHQAVDRMIVGTSRCWYGKVQLGPKAWRTVRLYSDKTASERELQKLQSQADQRAAGIATRSEERRGGKAWRP